MTADLNPRAAALIRVRLLKGRLARLHMQADPPVSGRELARRAGLAHPTLLHALNPEDPTDLWVSSLLAILAALGKTPADLVPSEP